MQRIDRKKNTFVGIQTRHVREDAEQDDRQTCTTLVIDPIIAET